MSVQALAARRGVALRAGLAAGFVLLAWAVLAPAGPVLAGWLIGLAFWGGISLGAMTLLAVRTLTGGAWLGAMAPALVPAAAATPILLPFILPLLFGLDALYPWAAGEVAQRPSVAAWYLNAPAFALRSLVAVAGWAVFAVLLARGAGGRVGAAALVFHAVAMSFIPLDWILSLDPRFRSSVFGFATGVDQVLAVLAWCALLRPEQSGVRGAAGDIARLMIAAALGGLYLGFAQYLVAWYGDLPDKVGWFLQREHPIWLGIEIASLLLASALPLVALLDQAIRRSPRAMAFVGGAVLAGLLLHQAWLVAPPVGLTVLATGALGVVAVGGAWIWTAHGLATAWLRPGMEAAHGGA